jgi:hypothetical protein
MPDSPPKALTAFFSYSPDGEKFVTDILESTQFRKIIGCKIVQEKNVSVGSKVEQITKLISGADLFIAFISRDYSSDAMKSWQLDQAIQSIINGSSFVKLQQVVFLVLDADGETWWGRRKTQADITRWCPDPAELNCVDEWGSAPDKVGSAEMTSKIESLANQIKEALKSRQPPPIESDIDDSDRPVILLGHPVKQVPDQIILARETLTTELMSRGVKPRQTADGWSASAKADPTLTALTSTDSDAIFVQPVDDVLADGAVDAPDALIEKIARASGDRERRTAVAACRRLFWLPAAYRHTFFNEKAETQSSESDPNPVLYAGSPASLAQRLASLLTGKTNDAPPPLISYERIRYDALSRVGTDIIVDQIIPQTSDPLKGRFVPDKLEPLAFAGEEDLKTCVDALARYDCGIFAIHNISGDIDEAGVLPRTFVEDIRRYDRLLKDSGPTAGLSLDRIIRLGIVATRMPKGHQFKYSRKLTDQTIAQWRFIALELNDDNARPTLNSSHVESLKVELTGLIERCRPGAAA